MSRSRIRSSLGAAALLACPATPVASAQVFIAPPTPPARVPPPAALATSATPPRNARKLAHGFVPAKDHRGASAEDSWLYSFEWVPPAD